MAESAPRTVVVAGGGNAAQALAGDLARAGHRVRLLELPGRPSRLDAVRRSGRLRIEGCGRDDLVAIEQVTTDAGQALAGADTLVVAVPAFAHAAFARATVPHLRRGQTVVLFTAALGGLEWARLAGGPDRAPPFSVVEVENLPYTCRVQAPGRVRVLLDVPCLRAGVFPAGRSPSVLAAARALFPQLKASPDPLEPLLCNINGVVHPPVVLLAVTRLERARGQPWWIWQGGVTPAVARLIESADRERLAIGRAFGLDLADAATLLHQSGYGPEGGVFAALNGCQALREVLGPSTLGHRWFSEDLPFCLRLWVDLAAAAGLSVPVMRALVELACGITGQNLWREGRALARFGLGGLGPAALQAYLRHGRR